MSGYDNWSYTSRAVAASATTVTLTAQDYFLIVTGGATAQAVTIPGAGTGTSYPGRVYHVINASGGTTTITPSAGTIDGAANLAVPTSTAVMLVSNGTNWYLAANGS